MANNMFNVRRVAHGTFTFPTNTAANTASTLSAAVAGVNIPTGAIVTGIWYYPSSTVTNLSAIKNGTINVYAGSSVLGTNDRKASEAILAGSALTQAVVAASGGYVTAGGDVWVNFASSDSDRSAIAFDASLFVEYLYASGVDTD